MTNHFMNDLSATLQEFGFAPEETNVYLYLYKNGALSVEQLAQQLNLSLLATKAALSSLASRGLVSHLLNGANQQYNAESAMSIIRHLEEESVKQQTRLTKIREEIIQLETDRPGKITVARFFTGKEGLKTMMDDFLGSGARDAYEAFPCDVVDDIFTDEEKAVRSRLRGDNNIFISGVYTKHDGDPLENNENRYAIRVDEEEYPLGADIIVYGDKIILASLEGELNGIIMQSEAVAKTLRSLFKMAMAGLEKKERPRE